MGEIACLENRVLITSENIAVVEKKRERGERRGEEERGGEWKEVIEHLVNYNGNTLPIIPYSD